MRRTNAAPGRMSLRTFPSRPRWEWTAGTRLELCCIALRRWHLRRAALRLAERECVARLARALVHRDEAPTTVLRFFAQMRSRRGHQGLALAIELHASIPSDGE